MMPKHSLLFLKTAFVRLAVILLSVSFPFLSLAEEEVVQTEVGLDQIKTQPKDAKADEDESADLSDMSPEERQLILINKSLKGTIEENKKLSEENKTIEDELRQLRGQRDINATRINSLSAQRDDYKALLDNYEKLNQQYTKELESLKVQMAEKEKEQEMKLKEMEEKNIQQKKEEESTLSMILSNPRSNGQTKQDMAAAKAKAKESRSA